MKFKLKDIKSLYVKRVEHALYCDFCEKRNVNVMELEDENETQICKSCATEITRMIPFVFKD